jgi:hypothetical protein
MLNIRTVILSVVVLVVLGLGAQLVTARTEVVSDPLSDPVIVLNHQDRYDKMNSSSRIDPVIVLDHQNRYDKMNNVPIPSYRSPLDVCYDVPLREIASCRATSQVTVPAYRSPLGVCYDVPLSTAAACRLAEQADTP